MKNDGGNIFAFAFGVLFVGAFVGIMLWNRMYERATVTLGGQQFEARVADSVAKRTKGLSGTDTLGRDEAMLFVFPEKNQNPFWMKDMNYAIDIIWVDGGMVVDIAPRVAPPAPGTPDESLPRYIPRLPAGQVVEVNAGTVDRLGIKIGDPVEIVADSRD